MFNNQKQKIINFYAFFQNINEAVQTLQLCFIVKTHKLFLSLILFVNVMPLIS